MQTIHDELKELHGADRPPLPISKRQILFVGVILGFGFYIGNLLYGTNSLLDLLNLQERSKRLNERVNSLNQENADLHKAYFELQLIKGEK